MTKTIYEEYGNYFLGKFKNDKRLKFDITNNHNIFCVYIYTDLDFDPYFIRIDKRGFYIDGCVEQDEGIECEDMAKEDKEYIIAELDKHANIFQIFLKNGLFIYCYKNAKLSMSCSIVIQDRKKYLKELKIEDVYKSCKDSRDLPFEEVDHIELRDFYNDIIYTYNKQEN